MRVLKCEDRKTKIFGYIDTGTVNQTLQSKTEYFPAPTIEILQGQLDAKFLEKKTYYTTTTTLYLLFVKKKFGTVVLKKCIQNTDILCAHLKKKK